MSRRVCATAILLVAALAAGRAYGQEDFAVPEYFSPEEEAERELERKKQAPAVLSVSPSIVRITLDANDDTVRTVTVSNAGGQSLTWSAKTNVSWIEVTPASGILGFAGEAQAELRVEREGLVAGVHRAAVVIDAGQVAGSPAKVFVTAYVAKAKPTPRGERQPARPSSALPPAEPQPVDRSDRRSHTDGPKGRFSVRAGAFLPTSGDGVEFGTDPSLGFSFGWGIFEYGFDFGMPVDTGRYESSMMYINRLDVLFGERAYLLVGGAVAVENMRDSGYGDNGYTNVAGAIDLGAGLELISDRADLRIVYQVLLGSDNLAGQTLLTAGWCF